MPKLCIVPQANVRSVFSNTWMQLERPVSAVVTQLQTLRPTSPDLSAKSGNPALRGRCWCWPPIPAIPWTLELLELATNSANSGNSALELLELATNSANSVDAGVAGVGCQLRQLRQLRRWSCWSWPPTPPTPATLRWSCWSWPSTPPTPASLGTPPLGGDTVLLPVHHRLVELRGLVVPWWCDADKQTL